MVGWQPDRPEARERLLAGDPLRAVGSLAVLGYHVLYTSLKAHGLSAGFAAFGVMGWFIYGLELAVPMFFALSAYLVGRPWIHAFILGEPLPRGRRYARSRFLRIAPIFWFVALVSTLRYGVGQNHGWLDLPALFGFAQTYHNSWAAGGVQQGWTIDVEVAFYVVLPLLIAALAPLGRRVSATARLVTLVGLLSVLALVSIYLRAHGPDGVHATLTWLAAPHTMFFAFAPGLLLATLEVPLRPWVTRNGAGTKLLEALCWTVALLAFLVYSVSGPHTGVPELMQNVTGRRTLFEPLASGALVAALLVRQVRGAGCPRLLDNAPLRWLGERTLSFYLLHMIVLIELTRAVPAPGSLGATVLLWGAIAVSVTLALSALTYRLVEAPFLARKAGPASAGWPTPAWLISAGRRASARGSAR